LSFAASRRFIEDLTDGFRSVLLASGLGLPPMTLDPKGFASWASPSQGSPVIAASARHFLLGDREFVALALADHQLALAAIRNLASDRIVEEAVLQPIYD
jgi:hypothetical protein